MSHTHTYTVCNMIREINEELKKANNFCQVISTVLKIWTNVMSEYHHIEIKFVNVIEDCIKKDLDNES